MVSVVDDARAWEDDVIKGLAEIADGDVPGLELLVLDAVASWVFSAENPGEGYGTTHGGELISLLFGAVQNASAFRPERLPVANEVIVYARSRIVAGTDELAREGRSGISLTISRLMPAVVGELQDYAASPGEQTYWVFIYLLYALATGTGGQDQKVMDGLMQAFSGWDGLLQDGFVMPSRR